MYYLDDREDGVLSVDLLVVTRGHSRSCSAPKTPRTCSALLVFGGRRAPERQLVVVLGSQAITPAAPDVWQQSFLEKRQDLRKKPAGKE